MARLTTPLTDIKINTAKPKEKDYKLFDGGGLFLLIKKNGSKSWRMKFNKLNGKETIATFGNYPVISLKEARHRREELKKLLSQGIDPAEEKQKKKIILQSGNTFKLVSLQWIKSYQKEEAISSLTTNARINRLEKYVFPAIGNNVINTLSLKDFITILNNIKKTGVQHVASRVRSDIISIMRYAVINNIIDTNPTIDLVGIKLSSKINHHPTLPIEQLGSLINKITNAHLHPVTKLTTLINIHLFIRSSELRFARWSEIDFTNKVWIIPEKRELIADIKFSDRGAKMMTSHLVPLSSQVVKMLKDIKRYTGDSQFIFTLNNIKPIHKQIINNVLRKLDYDTKTEICGHGFRSLACSALIESGLFSEDAIERQMSHMERNNVRAAYIHKAKHLEERIKIMQWWSNYIEHSRDNGYIAPYQFKNK